MPGKSEAGRGRVNCGEDARLYKKYGLTAEEIKIVEGKD